MFFKKQKNKRSIFDRIFGSSPSSKKGAEIVVSSKKSITDSVILQSPIEEAFVQDVTVHVEVPQEKPVTMSYPDFEEEIEPEKIEEIIEIPHSEPIPEELTVEEENISPKSIFLSYPDFREESETVTEDPVILVTIKNEEEIPRYGMRSLKPHRYISDEERFVLVSGEKLQTLHELRDALRGMPTHVWKNHVTPERNDFANWIEYVSQDPLLSYHSRACITPEALRALLSVSL